MHITTGPSWQWSPTRISCRKQKCVMLTFLQSTQWNRPQGVQPWDPGGTKVASSWLLQTAIAMRMTGNSKDNNHGRLSLVSDHLCPLCSQPPLNLMTGTKKNCLHRKGIHLWDMQDMVLVCCSGWKPSDPDKLGMLENPIQFHGSIYLGCTEQKTIIKQLTDLFATENDWYHALGLSSLSWLVNQHCAKSKLGQTRITSTHTGGADHICMLKKYK